MPYPIVSRASANRWYREWEDSGNPDAPPESPNADTSQDGANHDWPSLATRLTEVLGELHDLVEGNRDLQNPGDAGDLISMALVKRSDPKAKRQKNERFESAACIVVRESLPRDIVAFADPEFWHWMATGPGLDLIRRRYIENGQARIPDSLNFTSSKAQETFFYRLWIRAEMAHDPDLEDPYELARCGGVEFWRSHVYRQMSMESSALLAAFIRFQHPNGAGGKKRLTQEEIRKLIKRIRRGAANVVVEILDRKEAERFVEHQWQKIQEK